MNERERNETIERLKGSLMADHCHPEKKKILSGKVSPLPSSKAHYEKESIRIDLNDPQAGGLRTTASDTISAAGLLTAGCYYVTGGNWGYTNTLYSGISGNTFYYTTGVFNMVLLCNDMHKPISVIKEINIRFTGTGDSQYSVYANNGSDLVGYYTSVNGVYTVPYKTVTDQFHSNDFSISLADFGGFTTFSSSVEVVYTYEVSDISYVETNPHVLQRLDIRIPSNYVIGNTYPVILTIHGGDWSSGDCDKEDFNTYTDLFHEKGFVHASMNYRVNSGYHLYSCSDMLNDIHAALNKLKNSYGDFIIHSKAALLGWSAGAQLALMYTYTRTSPIPIKLVISEAGPVDLYGGFSEYVTTMNAHNLSPVYSLFDKLENLTNTSCPSTEFTDALYDISPAQKVTSSLAADVRTVIAYGTYTESAFFGIPSDGVITATQHTNLSNRLGSLGKLVSITELEGTTHANVCGYLPLHRTSDYFTVFSSAVTSFMSI